MRHLATANNRWPKLNRWLANQCDIELHVVKIIVQVRPLTAMAGVATGSYPRSALAPVANAPPILTGQIDNKNVGTAIALLGGAFETAACSCESDKIGIVWDGNQHVRVLGMGLVCGQGTNQSDLSNAWYHLRFLHKSLHGSKKHFAWRCIQRIGMADHGEGSCRLTPALTRAERPSAAATGC